jgi:hypothetical protein
MLIGVARTHRLADVLIINAWPDPQVSLAACCLFGRPFILLNWAHSIRDRTEGTFFQGVWYVNSIWTFSTNKAINPTKNAFEFVRHCHIALSPKDWYLKCVDFHTLKLKKHQPHRMLAHLQTGLYYLPYLHLALSLFLCVSWLTISECLGVAFLTCARRFHLLIHEKIAENSKIVMHANTWADSSRDNG